jgi:hypothetical protein
MVEAGLSSPELNSVHIRGIRAKMFAFRNTINFFVAGRRIGEKLNTNEGEEWIRRTARAAAVPDMLPGLWTSVESLKASHLSA